MTMQNRRVSTTTTSTMRSASGVTLAASTWQAPARNVPDASRTRSSATYTLPTSLSWKAPILCSSCAASSHSLWAAPSPDAKAAPRSSSRCLRRPVQVRFIPLPSTTTTTTTTSPLSLPSPRTSLSFVFIQPLCIVSSLLRVRGSELKMARH